mmetsp:Transcript_126856/g.353243  ORF Transcript_126856/g.353243 Transcript_126856/m.353243 type:complete len:215 (-) Transcript_126856:21-665(-)
MPVPRFGRGRLPPLSVLAALARQAQREREHNLTFSSRQSKLRLQHLGRDADGAGAAAGKKPEHERPLLPGGAASASSASGLAQKLLTQPPPGYGSYAPPAASSSTGPPEEGGGPPGGQGTQQQRHLGVRLERPEGGQALLAAEGLAERVRLHFNRFGPVAGVVAPGPPGLLHVAFKTVAGTRRAERAHGQPRAVPGVGTVLKVEVVTPRPASSH